MGRARETKVVLAIGIHNGYLTDAQHPPSSSGARNEIKSNYWKSPIYRRRALHSIFLLAINRETVEIIKEFSRTLSRGIEWR